MPRQPAGTAFVLWPSTVPAPRTQVLWESLSPKPSLIFSGWFEMGVLHWALFLLFYLGALAVVTFFVKLSKEG